jgi:hypothetical protein
VGFSIRIENVLPEAELHATADGEALPLAAVPGPVPTERAWRATLPPNRTARFDLRPPAGDAERREPFRFGVFADVQTAIDGVQDIYRVMNAEPGLRFVVMPGDQTQRGRAEQLARFQRELKHLRIPCYGTLGNHELGTRDDLFHDYFGRGNLAFAFRGVRFTLLDSASATLAPVVYDWLDGWSRAAGDDLHAVFMHIPPLDPIGLRNGGFASRAEGHALVGRLARAGVDVTFYGHIHSYYAFENASIPAFISGGGGAIPERFDGIGRHFLAVDVDPAARTFRVAVVRVDED